MNLPAYPLAQVLEIKMRRVTEAEKVVQEKKRVLEKEQETLKQRVAERDKVKKHRDAKLKQLRDSLDEGTTSPEIDQKKKYLDVVKDKLKVEEKKVKDQEAQVEVAKKNLEVAKEELNQRRKEVDKLETHKKEWSKEARKEMEVKETIEQDELGSIMFLTQWRKQE